jgi:hypothetical protein
VCHAPARGGLAVAGDTGARLGTGCLITGRGGGQSRRRPSSAVDAFGWQRNTSVSVLLCVIRTG